MDWCRRAWISLFLLVVPGLQSLFQGPSGAEQYSQHSGELDTQLCNALSLTGSLFPSLLLDHCLCLSYWITASLFYWIPISLSFTGSPFLSLLLDHHFTFIRSQYLFHLLYLSHLLYHPLSLTVVPFISLLLGHSFSLFYWVTVSLSFTGSQFLSLLLGHSFCLFYWVTVSVSFTGSLFPSLLLGHCFSLSHLATAQSYRKSHHVVSGCLSEMFMICKI